MERLQNPFSLYDFLGYLIPGSIMLYGLLFLYLPTGTQIGDVLKCYNLDGYEDAFLIIISSYSIGHIISFVSSLTIEKLSLWMHGYPSKYLLEIKQKGYFESAFYKGVGCNEYEIRMLARTALYLILLPISLLDLIFGKFFQLRLFYVRKLDSYTLEVVKRRIEAGINWVPKLNDFTEHNERKMSEYDFFRLIYHYCLENVSSHQSKFQNYVALYGFLRALSFISLALFWLLIITSIFEYWGLVLAFGAISYVCYMGYCKFSRRFTLEVLMAYITIEPPKTRSGAYTMNMTSSSIEND